jgi:hypothetical protein
MEYPQYRKLSNGQSFYMIENERKFVEIQIFGTQRIIHTINAEQYPEILRIKEMLSLDLPNILIASKNEIEQYLK